MMKLSAALALSLTAGAAMAQAQTAQINDKFDFGTAKASPGYTQVLPTTAYTNAQGYGFEPGTTVTSAGKGVAADQPFFFSAAVPEGNYNVTVTLGSPNAASITTVKAELRRLMLEKVQTGPGQTVTKTFTVNIRIPQISTGGQVRLKTREQTTEAVDWDNKLTLEFSNAHPAVEAITITKVDVPTLYILGDSTVCDQPTEPYDSWGQMLTRFFKPGIAVANNAESGESLASSLGARRLDKVLSVMKPGDYLFIQYGHNDQKSNRPDALAAYQADMKKFVDGARSKGGIPVIVTSMNRVSFDSAGKITNSFITPQGDYIAAARQVAKDNAVPLIDLNAMSKVMYETWGPQATLLAFATPSSGKTDHTHQDDFGSYEMAKCIVAGIKQDKLGIAKYLTDDAPTFDPSHPDAFAAFSLPADPQYNALKPLGS